MGMWSLLFSFSSLSLRVICKLSYLFFAGGRGTRMISHRISLYFKHCTANITM